MTRLLIVCGILAASIVPCMGADDDSAGIAPPEEILADWQSQDGIRQGKTYEEATAKVLVEVGPDARPIADAKDSAGAYERACIARRGKRLSELTNRYRQIVFTKHYDLGGSHYAYTEGQSDAQNERHFVPGASLCLLSLDGPFGRVKELLHDANGVIRDPDVSMDGKHVLFSWKQSLDEDDYHLYEMSLSDESIRQITFGLGYADYEGIYLPNGDLLFNSTRCVQTVDCWWTEVSNLYTCDGDGHYLRRVSHDQVHTNYPTATWDGRVLYTRWDYNDRGQIYPQSLFQMHPDGTYQTEFYGNNSWFPTAILHARSIPGTTKVVAVFSGHHCLQKGWLGILEPGKGRQENSGAQLIAPVRETNPVHVDAYGQEGDQFQYPYPINETEFIVTFKPAGAAFHFRIYWMNRDGDRELLAWDNAISCNQAIPVAGRPVPHERPALVDYRKKSGVFYVQDVYQGPGLAGVPRGTIKKLRVVALAFRAAGVGYNTNKGPAGGALASTPVSIEGTWDVKTVLGTTPVYEDGSACFNVPAALPVYFQALDANNEAVQTMRSWAQLQPGESFSCAGCHESKNSAPPPAPKSRALQIGARDLETVEDAPKGFSFDREIQPILDRHCVRCHFLDQPERMVDVAGPIPVNQPGSVTASAPVEVSADTNEKGSGVKPAFSLKGAPGTWSPSYRTLANRRVTNWINIQASPEMLPPYAAGAARSPLMKLVRSGHNGVQLAQEELDAVACWIDLLVPNFGDYTEGLNKEERDFYNKFLTKRQRWYEQEARNIQELLSKK